MHEELKKAIKNKDYEKICDFLCGESFSSDSTWTLNRVRSAFISGWKECEKILENEEPMT